MNPYKLVAVKVGQLITFKYKYPRGKVDKSKFIGHVLSRICTRVSALYVNTLKLVHNFPVSLRDAEIIYLKLFFVYIPYVSL